MSKSADFEAAFLQLVFNGVAIPGIADNAAAPLTALYVSLHIADPGELGNQATNEVTYTGYSRVAVTRSPVGWQVLGSEVRPVADIVFPLVAGGTGLIQYAAIGTQGAGVGLVLWSGQVVPPLSYFPGATPVLGTSSFVMED